MGHCVLKKLKYKLSLHLLLLYVEMSSSAPHHFNSEAFLQGRSLITQGMVAIKANIRIDNFRAARETLGKILHTLQVGVQLGISNLKQLEKTL